MNHLIKLAMEHEEKGRSDKSENYVNKALKKFPDDREVLHYAGFFMFRRGKHQEALDILVRLYNHEQSEEKKADLWEYILAAYYRPHEEAYHTTYEKNAGSLLEYPFNYLELPPSLAEHNFLYIPRSDDEYYVFNKADKKIGELIVMEKSGIEMQADKGKSILAIDVFDGESLQALDRSTQSALSLVSKKTPVYLIWEDYHKRHIALQKTDYTAVIGSGKFVFFAGGVTDQKFIDFFKGEQATFPERAVYQGYDAEKIQHFLHDLVAGRWEEAQALKERIDTQTAQYDKAYFKKNFTGGMKGLRILFCTCRFTVFAQYSARDFMEALRDMGISCDEFIEKSDIHGLRPIDWLKKIAEFKPHAIFFIDHVRHDFPYIPANIFVITWMQDPMPSMYSAVHAGSQGENDLVLPVCEQYAEFMRQAGYDPRRMLLQNVPVNEKKFIYDIPISVEERKFYSADVCFSSNYNDPVASLSNVILNKISPLLDEQFRLKVTECIVYTYDICQSRVENGELIYTQEQCEELLLSLFSHYGIESEISRETVKLIAKEFFLFICYGIHRRVALKWIVQRGFSLKIWGRYWEQEPEFRPYAMGWLKPGEELAKMYNCSKIVLGSCGHVTAHYRIWEALICGAMPIVRYIPPEFDMLDIRQDMVENEHFVFYYGKEDLFKKLEYYLQHEAERMRIVEQGRKRVLEALTYTAAARRCIDFMQGIIMPD
jgi:hypothetical protein